MPTVQILLIAYTAVIANYRRVYFLSMCLFRLLVYLIPTGACKIIRGANVFVDGGSV
jgi:hypothetical protein